MHTAIVILNWNGKHHLERFLPLLIARTEDAEIIIADGNSSDGSTHWIQNTYPELRIIELGGNYGYAGGYNRALEQVEADIFILLNSDVEVAEGWLPPIQSHFATSEAHGACQPKVLSFAERSIFEHAGAAGGFMDKYGFPFCRGRIFHSFEKDSGQYDNDCEVFWATGTCLAIRSDVWKEAGGFDEDLFAHMEEIDLCWRIHRCGSKVHCLTDSVIYHVGGGTLPYKHPRKTYLNFRNSLVVLTKNAPGPIIGLIVKRLLLDGIAAWKFLFEGKLRHFLAVARAHIKYVAWLPSTLRKRRRFSRKYPTAWPKGTYDKSIAWEYFVKEIVAFSALRNWKRPL